MREVAILDPHAGVRLTHNAWELAGIRSGRGYNPHPMHSALDHTTLARFFSTLPAMVRTLPHPPPEPVPRLPPLGHEIQLQLYNYLEPEGQVWEDCEMHWKFVILTLNLKRQEEKVSKCLLAQNSSNRNKTSFQWTEGRVSIFFSILSIIVPWSVNLLMKYKASKILYNL